MSTCAGLLMGFVEEIVKKLPKGLKYYDEKYVLVVTGTCKCDSLPS